jgi:hypothetical protein
MICSQTWNKRSKHIKVLVTHKTYKLAMMKIEIQNTKITKLNREAKAKNKPTKLSKENNHRESNLVIFSLYSNK